MNLSLRNSLLSCIAYELSWGKNHDFQLNSTACRYSCWLKYFCSRPCSVRVIVPFGVSRFLPLFYFPDIKFGVTL